MENNLSLYDSIFKLNSKIDIIKRASIFKDLDSCSLKQIALNSMILNYNKGDLVYREEDSADYLYVIINGKVIIFCNTSKGKIIVARHAGENDLFCFATFFSGRPLYHCAEVTESLSVLRFQRDDLLQVLDSHPDLSRKMGHLIEFFLFGLFNRFKAIIVSPVEQRIYGVLNDIYDRYGSNLHFRVEDIAELAGTTRETANRIITNLKKEGII
jgi:CRP-like cAMP-binding protein